MRVTDEAVRAFQTAFYKYLNKTLGHEGACIIAERVARPLLEAAAPEIVRAIDPEELARLFHENYERLAPQYNYETRKASAKPWADVPSNNKALMVATVRAALKELVSDD